MDESACGLLLSVQCNIDNIMARALDETAQYREQTRRLCDRCDAVTVRESAALRDSDTSDMSGSVLKRRCEAWGARWRQCGSRTTQTALIRRNLERRAGWNSVLACSLTDLCPCNESPALLMRSERHAHNKRDTGIPCC